MTNHYWDRATAPHADRDRTAPPTDRDADNVPSDRVRAYATPAQIKAAQDVLGCYRDLCVHGDTADGVCPRARNVANRVLAAEVPAGPPLHEPADRDGDNVPSDRRYAEFEVWDSSVPPGGMVCRECGTPVESEPCYQHNRAAREDRYAEAIDPGAFAETQPYPGRDPRPLWRQMAVQNARAVMAVADREQAALRAENDSLKAQLSLLTRDAEYAEDRAEKAEAAIAAIAPSIEQHEDDGDGWCPECACPIAECTLQPALAALRGPKPTEDGESDV